jgi:hypothetical protein
MRAEQRHDRGNQDHPDEGSVDEHRERQAGEHLTDAIADGVIAHGEATVLRAVPAEALMRRDPFVGDNGRAERDLAT